MHLLLSPKYLAYPLNWGSFMHNGIISSLLLYPVKYFNEPLLPYESLSDIAILLISILSMLICC